MAVLLTGGTGFIGSHTCVRLLNSGERVVILDNLSNSSPDVVERIREITGKSAGFVEADILSESSLREVFSKNDIESVVHFAGRKAVGESVEIPLEYYTTNVSGTLNLLRVMREYGCRRMVFSSSATVYGDMAEMPCREQSPISAVNPYGQTKVIIERILRDLYVSDNSWSIALLRYFNPVGAHKSGLLGENPSGTPDNLVPYIAQVAAGRLPKLRIFGGDYDTPDGTGVRDYIHVEDLAAGHLAALDYVRKNCCCEPVNLGTGTGYSVYQVLAAYEKVCGHAIPREVVPRRAGDIAECCADVSKARTALGWEAKLGLLEMCEDSWRYARRIYGV
ncbi:MAG: UDP-glucose 4-epimerase GalE [Clostridiales bacterium]|nr:UDP-glucose 4-epimerase GalE [Clostridiales bacterium]